MTKSRKLLGLTLLFCFALSALVAVGVFGIGTYRAVAADLDNVDNYFGAQLKTDEQKEFYKAMQEMHLNEIFIKGEDYDLVASGHVTQKQLEEYANGNLAIIDALGAARDAFYTDYVDIFYVDFGYISLRVTQDNQGYHAWLGRGRADTYFVEGVTAANVQQKIDEYEEARDQVLAEVQKVKPNDNQIKSIGDEKLAEQIVKIREAHRQVVKKAYYRLESEAKKGAGYVRTPYGVFVTREALCEGYSRAFKVLMDELGVPCVLVNGAYRHGNNQEEVHMWTYVQLLDGNWYAVDPTFDDLNFDDREKWPADKYPGIANRTTPLDKEHIPTQFKEDEEDVYDDEIGIYYNEDYFLKGAAYMNTQHATSPYKSEVEYPFTYPELCQHNFGMEVTLAHGGLFKVVQAPHDGSMTSTDIYVSVLIDGEWCGYAGAAERHYYILVRYEGDFLPEKLKNHQDLSHLKDDEYVIEKGTMKRNTDSTTVWAYLNPFYNDGEMYSAIIEGDGYTVMQDTAKSTGFEFALTTRAPRPYDKDETDLDIIAEMTTYTGDLTMFEARSGFIPVKYGDPNYQPAPHIVRSTPTHTCKLLISSFREADTYDITVEYDQVLKFIGDAKKIEMSVYAVRATGEILKGTNAVKLEECVDLSSVTCDLGEDSDGTFRCGSVSFKFTPYKAWAYDNIEYIFNFNLEGVRSHKQVNPATYAAGYECEATCYLAFGYHWNVFAQPRLLDEGDLSRTDWKDSNGNDVSNTKDRLALVVTKPTEKQEGEMMDMIDDEFGEDVLESFTYNITLTICKSIVIETGMGVRVCVGFPEGFTYSDTMNGVAFKAYHFTRDKWDNITGVEEIECTVTPLGLVLLCKSFSPFAIVAATADPADVPTEKSVMITGSNGGSIVADTVDEGDTNILFNVKEEQSRKITVKAESGYVIESIKINGNVVPTNFESEKTLTLSYADLTTQSRIEVSFVAQSVKASEESRGESVVSSQLKKAEITLSASTASVKPGERIQIKATVTAYGDKNTYQWYKDGKALAGQNGKTLLIKQAQTTDSGDYTLVVTSSSSSSTVTAQSIVVKVSVSDKQQAPSDGNSGNSGNNSGNNSDNNNSSDNKQNPGKLSQGELVTLIIGIIGGVIVLIFIIALIVYLVKKKK